MSHIVIDSLWVGAGEYTLLYKLKPMGGIHR